MGRKKLMGSIQKFGKALMTPVAVLPAAAILLRFGAEDVLNIGWIEAGGGAIFDNLPLIFAIGIAIGLAKESHGVSALAAAIGYLVLTSVASTIDESVNMGIIAGIISGLLAASLYNKYNDIRVPDVLGFFGGKRFVPIITSIISLGFGLVAGFVWPFFQSGIDAFGNTVIGAGPLGVFIFGFLNRLLLPFGLHHILNNIAFFQIGTFTDASGAVITGDLARFFAGDPAGGMFTAGGYAVMLFGLPAVCYAMVKLAKKENRKAVSGILLSAALTSIITGITEPIEFVFMFISPVLLVVHSVLFGLFGAAAAFLGIRLGATFSNGLIDYVLLFNAATKPLLLIPLGLVAAVLYFSIFYFVIKKFNVPTPGRIDDVELTALVNLTDEELTGKSRELIDALGGAGNIGEMDACITRIRVSVRDDKLVDEDKIRAIGVTNIVKLGSLNYQIIVGTVADPMTSRMKALMR